MLDSVTSLTIAGLLRSISRCGLLWARVHRHAPERLYGRIVLLFSSVAANEDLLGAETFCANLQRLLLSFEKMAHKAF